MSDMAFGNTRAPAAPGATAPCALPPAALDKLMPMHLQISAQGIGLHAGPTLRKIAPVELVGAPMSVLVDVLRPRGVQDLAGLRAADGGQVRLRLKGAENVPIKGISVPLACGGVLLNLSFGYAVTSAVDRFHLTCGDFAITDLTIEMLYLIEAKSAAQEEQRKLNLRLHSAKQRAEAEALSDGLTGLANRRAFDLGLERALANGGPFSVMQIDLDYFKSVNDRLGHAAGDRVLEKVAEVLQAHTRSSDLVARVGGDEFTILFPRFADREALLTAARRIIKGLEEPVPFGSQLCRISGSIGIALHPAQDGAVPDADTVMRQADTATYASKFRGRAQATLYTPDLDGEVAAATAAAAPAAR